MSLGPAFGCPIGILRQETGLHYNWHRYYDPKTGRYLTNDPIGLVAGLNTYAYVDNNPLRWIDPSGFAKSSVDAAIEQAVIRGDINQLRFLLENAANVGRAESEALLKRCAQNLPDKIGKIASETGRSPKEIARAIEQVKQQGLPKGTGTRNPDVRVDPRTGEVYPKTPDGGVGDSIGNIFEILK
jgi:RHS repeat-associated protein